jgi:AhpD family alkylhydroperoxidase
VEGKVEGKLYTDQEVPVERSGFARIAPDSGLALTLAASPAAREGFVALRKALAKGSLTGRLQEKIALLVADRNACAYCAAAHEELAAKLGIDDDEIAASRRASSADTKEDATLKLAAAMVDRRGGVSEEELTRARAAGLGDAEIVEVVANVALNLFRNYFALAGQPTAQIDASAFRLAGDAEGDARQRSRAVA